MVAVGHGESGGIVALVQAALRARVDKEGKGRPPELWQEWGWERKRCV